MFRYHRRVFVTPPWPQIFAPDTERKQTFEQAEATYETMIETYSAFGYELIPLPLHSVEERVRLVLAVSAELRRLRFPWLADIQSAPLPIRVLQSSLLLKTIFFFSKLRQPCGTIIFTPGKCTPWHRPKPSSLVLTLVRHLLVPAVHRVCLKCAVVRPL